MRQGCLYLLFLFCFPSYAKVDISVPKFTDKSGMSSCPGSLLAKQEADTALQAKLIEMMQNLERYQIQQREVRPMVPAHRLVGTVRMFEVCARAGQPGEDAKIELELQLLDSKGQLTHVFNSNSKTSSSAQNRAGDMAIEAAVLELAKRIDSAIPGKRAMRLTYKNGRAQKVADNEYQIQMIRRPNFTGKRR